MLALILAVRAFVLAASTGFFYTVFIDDGPAKTLQGYLKLGYHQTIEMPKLLAYSAPLRRRSSYDAPPFSIVPPAGSPEISRAGSQELAGDDTLLDVHTVEPAHNSSTAVCPFAPTKTYDSHRFLPALGSWMNATLPTALVIHPQTLQNATFPTSLVVRSRLLPHQLSAVPEALQYGLSKAFGDTPSDLPFHFEFCLIIFLFGVFLAIYIILRYRTAKAEAVARLERNFLSSFADAMINNTSVQERLQGLEGLKTETGVQAILTKISVPPNIASILAEMIVGLKNQQMKINLGQIIPPEAVLKGKIRFLNRKVSKLTVSQIKVNKKYQHRYECYQDALTRNSILRDTNKSLESQKHALESTRADKDQQNADLEVKVEELIRAYEQATANSDSLVGKCQGLVSENTRLEQANGDLTSRNDGLACSLTASETSVSNLSKKIDEYIAQEQQAEDTHKSMQLAIDTGMQKLDRVRSDRDALSQRIKEYQSEAQFGEEALAKSQLEVKLMLAEKNTTEIELKKAKEEKDALAKQVAALSTARPPPSQPAPASFNTSSYQSVPNQGPVSQEHLSKVTQAFEERVYRLEAKLNLVEHEKKTLESGGSRTSSNQLTPMNLSRAHHHGSGGPGLPPMRFQGHSAHPQIISGSGFQGNSTGVQPPYNGGLMGPIMGPGDSLGYMSFPPGGASQGMNSGFLPHPQALNGPNSSTNDYQWPLPTPQSHPSPLNNGGPAVSPRAQDGYQHNSWNPWATPFTPGRGN